MNRNSLWTNSDGLVVGFGTRDVESTGSAKVSLGGRRQQVVFKITGTDLADSDVSAQLVNAVVIPAGSILESAKLFVESVFAGATAVLDIGIYKASDGTAVDDDGVDAAIAVTSIDGDGDIIACDGALIGTELAFDSKLGASYDTAAFTSGVAYVTVEFISPAV
jgi:hypothetical protein